MGTVVQHAIYSSCSHARQLGDLRDGRTILDRGLGGKASIVHQIAPKPIHSSGSIHQITPIIPVDVVLPCQQ
jgi:hypothetical protein